MNAPGNTEERFAAAHTWMLLAMWRRARLVSGLLITTALLLLARLACSPLDPLPGEVRFLPLFLLGPVAAVLLGPAGVWAAAVASLLADFLTGGLTPVAAFRAAGEFAAALHVFVLWDSSFFRRRPALDLAPTWRHVARFAALAVPAGLVAATWNALGVELCGTHAFGFAAAVEAAQVLLFVPLLAPALYRAAARDIAGHLGDWRSPAGQTGRWSHWRPVGLPVATLVAAVILPCGLLLSIHVTGQFPWNSAAIGLTTGGALPEFLAGLLVLHLLTVLWPD